MKRLAKLGSVFVVLGLAVLFFLGDFFLHPVAVSGFQMMRLFRLRNQQGV
ncbi:hypothetical protein [Massilia frigida]|nr:hypothetical protein [Massilia frigida]